CARLSRARPCLGDLDRVVPFDIARRETVSEVAVRLASWLRLRRGRSAPLQTELRRVRLERPDDEGDVVGELDSEQLRAGRHLGALDLGGEGLVLQLLDH